jgi:hypothetical protein
VKTHGSLPTEAAAVETVSSDWGARLRGEMTIRRARFSLRRRGPLLVVLVDVDRYALVFECVEHVVEVTACRRIGDSVDGPTPPNVFGRDRHNVSGQGLGEPTGLT